MSPLNEQVLKKKFCRDTVKDVKSLLKAWDFGAVVNLSNACYSVRVHRFSRTFCCFIIDGQVYEYVELPMGLTYMARLFHKGCLVWC